MGQIILFHWEGVRDQLVGSEVLPEDSMDFSMDFSMDVLSNYNVLANQSMGIVFWQEAYDYARSNPFRKPISWDTFAPPSNFYKACKWKVKQRAKSGPRICPFGS